MRGKESFCTEHKALSWREQTRRSREVNSKEQEFYNSKPWVSLSRQLKAHEPRCRACMMRGRITFGSISDHIIPLKLAWHLRLDPVNIQTLCHPCHNRKRTVEQRLYENKGLCQPVTIVAGPPGAGKTTYVKENKKRGDVVIDFDYLLSALTFLPVHDKPEHLIGLAHAVTQDAVARLVLLGAERPRSWLIGTLPTRQERQRIAGMFDNVRVVVLDTPAHVCIERIRQNPYRTNEMQEYIRVVNNWWNEYEPE